MVAFEDHFWGDKNAGYDVLYHNMKYGNNASKELADFFRDRASVEENYVKSLQKLARSAASVNQLGSFDPLWGVLRVSTDKLASAHQQVIQKLHDLMKDLKDYGEKQKEKHKTTKEEFSSTAEIVQTIQTMTAALLKAKENYYARCQDVERCRKDGTHAKDIEKAEIKMKKAAEEYKGVVEKREMVRNEFHDRMADTSKKFQKIEEEHLKSIIGYLESYIESQRTGQRLIKQVHDEFQGQLSSMTVDRLLEQFVRGKGTGTDIPDVVPFEEYGMQVINNVVVPHENSPSVNQGQKPLSMSTVAGLSLVLKKKEKKEKKKKKKKKEKEPQNGPVDSPSSEGNEATTPAYEVDEEGYTIRPHDTESMKSRGSSFSSDSDSDDDDEPRKIQVHIRPVAKDNTSHPVTNEEFKKITLNLSSPSSKRKNASSSSLTDFRGRARSGNSTMKLSSSSSDLLDIDFSQSALSNPPGAMGEASSTSTPFSSPKFQVGEPSVTSSDFTSLDPLSSPLDITGTTAMSLERGIETPPALPAKKSSPPATASSDSPPPLPAKKGTGSPTESLPSSPSVSEVSSMTLLEKSLQGSSDAAKTLPFLKPPPSSDLPRASSVSRAVPRPRPQAGSQRPVGGGLSLTSQSPTTSATTMSYSAELLSCFSDFNMSTTAVTSENSVDTLEANHKDALSAASETSEEPSTNLFSKAAANHNYTGSGPLPHAGFGLSSSKFSGSGASLQKSVTTSSLTDSQESVKKLSHSKTVGGLPTVAGVMSGTSTRGAAGSAVAKKEDTIPIAVAFIESVNAFFRGKDHSKCMVKVTGDITVSFPASVVPLLSEAASPPTLTFHIKGTASLEQILPNKSLITSEGQLSGGDAISFRFNMSALAEQLKKQKEQGPSSYYNLDILKYEVKSDGFKSTPLQLCSFWKCDENTTDLRVDYRYNPECMSTSCPVTNMSVIVPVNGGVTIMQSKPSATWSAEHQRALWKLQEVSSSIEPQGILRAKFDVSDGPSKPSRIAVQFTCNGATISKLNFELQSSAYKLSLVKKRFTSGKYIAES